MSKSLAKKILTAVVVGVVWLAHLSSAAAGMLLCIEAAAESDCCPEVLGSPEFPVDEAKKLLDGSDCICCIAIDQMPRSAGGSAPKVALDIASGPVFLRSVFSSMGMAILSARSQETGGTRLGCLRTVVLLV